MVVVLGTVLRVTGGKAVESGGEDGGAEVVETGEKQFTVAISGQQPAQRDGQSGPVGGRDVLEEISEVSRSGSIRRRDTDRGDDRLPGRQEMSSLDGYVGSLLIGRSRGGGQ